MVTIFSIPNCPYCTELKTLLNSNGISFKDIDVSLVENNDVYQQILEVTKSDQVPIIRVKNHLLVPEVSFKTIKEASMIIIKLLN